MQVEYWQNVSETAKQFVRKCLTVDPTNRPTSDDLLADPWLQTDQALGGKDVGVPAASGGTADLLPNVKKAFDAKKTCEFSRLLVKTLPCLDHGPLLFAFQSARLFWG